MLQSRPENMENFAAVIKPAERIVDLENDNTENAVGLPPMVVAETAGNIPRLENHGSRFSESARIGLNQGVTAILFRSKDSDEIYKLPVTIQTSKTGKGMSSKLAEIIVVIAASAIFTLIGIMNSKASYSTETKILAGVLATGFAGAMISMLMNLLTTDASARSDRVSTGKLQDFLVKMGALCVYSAVMGSMAILLDVGKLRLWEITAVCILFLAALFNIFKKISDRK